MRCVECPCYYWDDYEDDYSYYSGYYKSHLYSGT